MLVLTSPHFSSSFWLSISEPWWTSRMVVVNCAMNPPTPCLWQAPTSAQKTKKENQAGHSSERAVKGHGGPPERKSRAAIPRFAQLHYNCTQRENTHPKMKSPPKTREHPPQTRKTHPNNAKTHTKNAKNTPPKREKHAKLLSRLHAKKNSPRLEINLFPSSTLK